MQQQVQRTLGTIDAVRASDVGSAPPVFHPVLHALRAEGRAHRAGHVEVAR
jgi:hypothetical protein